MISSEEAHKVLHEELGYSQDRSRAMIDKFDSNRDGQVSYMEFAEFYVAVEEKYVYWLLLDPIYYTSLVNHIVCTSNKPITF